MCARSAVVAAAFGAGLCSIAQATVMLGGSSFDDNAFADSLSASAGTWTFGGATLEASLVGPNADDFAFSFDPGAFVALEFVDNAAVNGPGPDLAIFELGSVEPFRVEIGGVGNNYSGIDTGEMAGGFALVKALIDLSDFGIAPDASITSLRLIPSPTGGDPADLTVIGASNNIPSPAGLPLAALVGLGAMRRRRID